MFIEASAKLRNNFARGAQRLRRYAGCDTHLFAHRFRLHVKIARSLLIGFNGVCFFCGCTRPPIFRQKIFNRRVIQWMPNWVHFGISQFWRISISISHFDQTHSIGQQCTHVYSGTTEPSHALTQMTAPLTYGEKEKTTKTTTIQKTHLQMNWILSLHFASFYFTFFFFCIWMNNSGVILRKSSAVG